MLRRIVFVLIAVAVIAAARGESVTPAVAAPAPAGQVTDGDFTTVSEFPVALSAGVAVTFETTVISFGSDPVLHLLNSAGSQVAVNDNITKINKASRLTFTPSAAGAYRVVVRAKTQLTQGTANLTRNGAVLAAGVRFGGLRVLLAGLRPGEVIETVRLPHGAGPVHQLFVLAPNGVSIAARVSGNGTAGGTAYTVPFATQNRYVVAGVGQSKGTVTGPGRIVRNDAALAGHDPDGDGLGSDAEAALGTCSSLTGSAGTPSFACNQAVDARDTDGDGISDRWEALGRRDMLPHQPLPLWGANPRHKDLFVEVDFMRRSVVENFSAADATMPETVARLYDQAYGDRKTTVPLIAAYHAALLKNPDGKPGIATHIDSGRSPVVPADATLYGNWGGHNAVNAVCAETGCVGACDGAGESCVGAQASASWQANMTPVRRGIFRYALAYKGGGGSAAEGFAASYNMDSATNSVHETGHSMGIGHAGPMGIETINVNCKPNYPSLMNYAYADVNFGFTDGQGRTALNNAALREWQAVAPTNTSYLDDLESRFKYRVDRVNGHVDWNRDGVFAPSGTTVAAYANYAPGSGGGGCEHTRYHAGKVPNAVSTVGPAVVRLGSRIYLFSNPLGALQHISSTSTWNCRAPNNDPCGTWGAPSFAPTMNVAAGVDAVRMPYSIIAQQILVVGVGSDKRLREVRMHYTFTGAEVWGTPANVPNITDAVGEPSVAVVAGRAYVVYRTTSGALKWTSTDKNGAWTTPQAVLTPEGAAIVLPAYASPGIGVAYLAYRSGAAEIYGAFADSEGKLDLYWFNRATLRWVKTDRLDSRPGPIEGRPALQWIPTGTAAGSTTPGRLELAFLAHNTTDPVKRQLNRMTSYTKFDAATNTLVERVGLQGPHDNVWLYARGIDFLYEPAIDTNLRAAITYGSNHGDDDPTQPKDYQVWFRPAADGVIDFTYKAFDDWQVLRYGVCRHVVDPTNTIPDATQIRCPAKTW